jgi:hypothetical protein
MKNYIDLLKEELCDAEHRLCNADAEGYPIIADQIQQIKRDIKRNSQIQRKEARS